MLTIGYNLNCQACATVLDAAERLAEIVRALCSGNMMSVVACSPTFYVVTFPSISLLTPTISLHLPERWVYHNDVRSFAIEAPAVVSASRRFDGDIVQLTDELFDLIITHEVVRFSFLNAEKAKHHEEKRQTKMRDRAVGLEIQRAVRNVNRTLWSKLKQLAKGPQRIVGISLLTHNDILVMLTAEELAIVGYMKEISEIWTQRFAEEQYARDYFQSLEAHKNEAIASTVERTSISLAELLFRLTTAADVTAALSLGKSVRMIADPVVGQPTLYRWVKRTALNALVAVSGMLLMWGLLRRPLHMLKQLQLQWL